MSEISSHFIDVDGIRTHYLSCGDDSRPAVVLVHGGGAGASSRSNWSHLLPVFGANYRTLAVDMVGFGDTDKPDPQRAGQVMSREGRGLILRLLRRRSPGRQKERPGFGSCFQKFTASWIGFHGYLLH